MAEQEQKTFTDRMKLGGPGEITLDPDRPLSRNEVPVSELEGFDFDKDLDKSAPSYEGEDLQVEPPEYRKPSVSIKTSGTVKFSEGLCNELLDRGGYRFLGGVSIVKRQFLLLTLYKFESLPKGAHRTYQIKTPLEVSKEVKGSAKGLGEIKLVNELRRAELSDRNDIRSGQLIPERGLYSSIEFDLGSFSFDTSLIEAGQLRLVIDISKAVYIQRGKRLSKADRELALHRFTEQVDRKLGLNPEKIDIENLLWERIEDLRAEEDTDADRPEADKPEEDKVEGEEPKQETPVALFPKATGA